MPDIDFNAITAYYRGERTHAAIRAGIYLSRLPEGQQRAISDLFPAQ